MTARCGLLHGLLEAYFCRYHRGLRGQVTSTCSAHRSRQTRLPLPASTSA